MFRKLLNSVLIDIRNGEIEGYLALIFACIAFIIGIFDSDQALTLAIEVIAAVLALLSLSIVRNRRTAQDLNKTLQHLQKSISSSGHLQFRGYLEDEIRHLVKNAKKELSILIPVGNSLRGIYSELKMSLERDCSIRIVMSDTKVSDLIVLRSPSIPSIEDAESNLNYINSYLNSLAVNDNRIICKKIPYVPSISIYLADSDENFGKIVIFITPFGASSFEAPSLVFNKSEDPELFAYFKSQFENYWGASQE